jgi:hypothetical protein
MTKKLDEATKLANKQKREEAKLIAKNKAFNKLSKTAKKLAIIDDALAQVKLGKIIPKARTYYEICEFESLVGYDEEKYDVSIQSLLPQVSCNACAKGFLLLSTINKRNQVTLQDMYNAWDESDFIEETISDIFTKNQLDLIETAFEKDVVVDNYYLADDEGNKTKIAEKAIQFGSKYKTDESRLVAILNNMKKNNGTFKP